MDPNDNAQAGRLAALTISLLLAACGGGGGGSGGDGPSTAASTSLNRQNSNDVAGAVMSAAQQNLNSLPGMTGGAGSAASTAQSRIVARAAGGTYPYVAQQTRSSTQACPRGGNITVTADVSGNRFSEGDSLSLTFNDCGAVSSIYGPSVINGSVSTTLANVRGTPFVQTADWSVVYATNADLVLVSEERTVPFRGEWRYTYAYDASSASFSVDYDTLTYQAPSGDSITWQGDYRVRSGTDSNGTTRFSIDGTADYAGLGEISVTTTEEFVVTADGRFVSGSMLIESAADGSAARISAVPDTATLSIELDREGDGAFETNYSVTYGELLTAGG